jgi:hypothetical protein
MVLALDLFYSKASPCPLFRYTALTSWLRASTNVAASPASAAQTIRSFNPQVLAFQPTVAQNSDLYSNQPAVFHNSQIYSKPSTVSQNNGIYPSMPTGPQHDDSHTNSYPGYGLYTADMHNARNNINTPGEESINHTAPYGAFNTAATEPDHFSNVHSHVHSHGHTHIPTHVHATERQGTTYFGYPEGDVEGLIISHNSLGNHNHNYVPTEAMVPQDQFVPTSVLIPYDSVLARKNAAKAAVLKKDEHKPGKPCPDGHPNCHWHYSRWCHESPVTCRSARKYFRLIAHPIFIDLLLQFRQSPQPFMLTARGRMPRWAGTRYMSPACAQLIL